MSRWHVSAVLFDLDGTLVDTAPDIALAINAMLVELGRAEVSFERIKTWIGDGAARLVKRALTGATDGEPDAELFERALPIFRKHHAANLVVHSAPYPGVPDMLRRLVQDGFRLGVITNKPAMFTQPLLSALKLSGYFGVIVSGDSLPAKKPDPSPLLHGATALGASPGRSIMVGDSRNDVLAARAAQMPVIAVSYGYNHGNDVRDLDTDLVVDSLTDLPQYLRYSD